MAPLEFRCGFCDLIARHGLDARSAESGGFSKIIFRDHILTSPDAATPQEPTRPADLKFPHPLQEAAMDHELRKEGAAASPFIEADLTEVEAEIHTSDWTPVDKPLRGIVLVLISTVFLSSSDTMAKYLAFRLSAVEIGWLRYLTFMLIMCPAVLLATSPRQTLHSVRPDLQILRGMTLVGTSLLFISA
jgi:hypothetical protein